MLRRSVLSCLLWEDEFYEDGQSIAARITAAAEKVTPPVLAALAIEAREVFNLRHVPLLLLEVLSRTGKGDKLVADTVARVIQRADELGELVALHHKLGAKKMLPAQMRKGLARAFAKFDAYALAKYDRDTAVKLRDVLRLVRPTPQDAEQSALWKGVKDRTLAGAGHLGGRALGRRRQEGRRSSACLRERQARLPRPAAQPAQHGAGRRRRRAGAAGHRRSQGRRTARLPVPLCCGGARGAAVRAGLDQALQAAIAEMRRCRRQDHRARRRLGLDGSAGCPRSPT